MKAHLRAGFVIAFCVAVGGCATPSGPPVATAAMTPATNLATQNARDAIMPGKSTKADVLAAMGKTTVIRFDNNFEVWVYRFISDSPATVKQGGNAGLAGGEKGNLAWSEFVLLFDPSGVVTKVRVREAPDPG